MAPSEIDILVHSIFREGNIISEKSYSLLRPAIKYITMEKGEVFIKINQKNNSEYFILNGYCRSFLVNPDGEEITLAFFKEKNALSPHITRTKNGKSLLNFQALTLLTLAEFNAEVFLSLMIENTEIRDFANTVLKDELIKKTEREIALASHTATQRLNEFREEFGPLENLIPHPVIASYLGITNVSLSRLRGKIK